MRKVLPVIMGGAVGVFGVACGESAKPDPAASTKVTTPGTSTTAKIASSTPDPLASVVKRMFLDDPMYQMAGGLGSVEPIPPPSATPSGSARAAGSAAPAARSPMDAAMDPPGAMGMPGLAADNSQPARRDSIPVVHNHPPGQACTPISRAELEKAFRDLK